MEDKNADNVWFIPQGVSFEIIKSILSYCYNSQKRNVEITGDGIKKIVPKSENTVKNTIKMLENIKILNMNVENNTYQMDVNSMAFAEKLASQEDVTKEINTIIENSFLSDIQQIILSNKDITRDKLIEKILINSTAGTAKEKHPYVTTINSILDLLNLSGSITEEQFLELRGNTEKNTAHRTISSSRKKSSDVKKEKPSKTTDKVLLQDGVHGIVKTPTIEIQIKNIEDLEFARMALDRLEKTLSESGGTISSNNQITT